MSPLDRQQFDIVEVRLRALAPVRLARPFWDATGGPFETFALAAITVRDADGFEGEALAAGLPFLEATVIPHLLRAGARPYAGLYPLLYWSVRNASFRGPAASAVGCVDLALHDLAARRVGRPLHRLLGATRDWVTVYGSGGGTGLSQRELVDEMTALAAAGYGCLKMKVGRSPAEDLDRIKAVRAAIGPDVALAVDSNQIFSADEALAFAGQIAEHDIAWFEEPVHSADLLALRRYAATAPIPAALGESEMSSRVFPSLVEAGARHLQPMPAKLAGVAEWMTVRDLAARHGLALSCPGFPQQGAYLAATGAESLSCEYLFPVLGFVEDLFAVAPRIHNGRCQLGDEAGLATRLDWDRLAREDRVTRDQRWTPRDFEDFAIAV